MTRVRAKREIEEGQNEMPFLPASPTGRVLYIGGGSPGTQYNVWQRVGKLLKVGVGQCVHLSPYSKFHLTYEKHRGKGGNVLTGT